MAMAGELRTEKLLLLFFIAVFLAAVCDGTKKHNLEELVRNLKGKSDQVANEIYTWIGKQSRDQSPDRLKTAGLSKSYKKQVLGKLIKILKGESDHLANEIYAWIDEHGKGFSSRAKSRGSVRHHLGLNGTSSDRFTSKKRDLEHLVQDLKGESDLVANEIYAWIGKHSNGSQSRDQSPDRLKTAGLSKSYKKQVLGKLIKTLKGESDHLANEIYAWMDEHGKGFSSRAKSRVSVRHHLGLNGTSSDRFTSKKRDLEHLVQDLKGESDQVANEIYAWIDKHSNGSQSRDRTRVESRDHSERPTSHKKKDLGKMINTLKGESNHLANELYAWIDKHRSGFLARAKSRGRAREHLRSRRSSDLEGESIQDVMLGLMSAPHSKQKHHDKPKLIKKINKSVKRKRNKKAKTPTTKRSPKKGSKNKKKRIKKHIKPVTHSKKSKIPKKEKGSTAHVTEAVKKSDGLAELLKLVSADPSKKIVVTKGKNGVTLDKKSLKLFNDIPKPVLDKLIANIQLNKYLNIDTYISGEEGKGKVGKVEENSVLKSKLGKLDKTSKQKVVTKQIFKKAFEKSVETLHGKKRGKYLKGHKGKGSRKGSSKKFVNKRTKKKSSNTKLRKGKKKDEQSVSKSRILKLKKSKKNYVLNNKEGKRMNGKERHIDSHIGHQKLSGLKEKIKKTNSLKFKVAKALLEHCETQNKLKRIFDNVNASLKEASVLAKAIGKKFGIRKIDIDKFTTKHTEKAVQDFLNNIF